MKKKKLLYIVRYPIHESFNLKGKFDGQLHAFEVLGFDVFYLTFDRQHFYLMNNAQQLVLGSTHWKFPGYFHTLCYNDLYRLARQVVDKYHIDCVYWRAAPELPASIRLAKQIKKSGAHFIYEYPTYPHQAEKSLGFLRSVYAPFAALLRKKLENAVDGFVLIGQDAGGTYRGKPAINISNGIDLSAIPVRHHTPDPNAIHIMALASMSYWHGYDRLIRSLAAYTGKHRVVIHMVGGNDGGALPEWQELTRSLNLTDQVLFHGPKSGEELDRLFNLCDIGVNSLGLYRKGFSVTSELKTRECIARGLPFVCSVEDSVLQYAPKAFWLRVPNDDSIPDMDQIVSFALQMRAECDLAESMRSYAREHLAWETQYRQVFEFLKI